MALPKGYANYGNSKILTASPAELTLMLYEGAIKYCNVAIMALEKKDFGKANAHIIKSEKIIDYLQVTLDMKYPVAKNFDDMYNYLMQRMIEANLKKDTEILEEVCGHLRSIRDTWKEVTRISKEKGVI